MTTIRTTPAGASAVLRQWVREVDERISDASRDAVRDAIRDGGEIAKSKVDRVDTGYMKSQVSSRIDVDTRDAVKGEFGWLSDDPYYALFQEYGFQHTNGSVIKGMYALQDTLDELVPEIEQKIKKSIA